MSDIKSSLGSTRKDIRVPSNEKGCDIVPSRPSASKTFTWKILQKLNLQIKETISVQTYLNMMQPSQVLGGIPLGNVERPLNVSTLLPRSIVYLHVNAAHRGQRERQYPDVRGLHDGLQIFLVRHDEQCIFWVCNQY